MPEPIPPPRDSGTTTTTTAPLYWCAYGPSDAPRLLVLHGGPGAHHDYLLPQMLHLAERYNVIFYDQRGGGRSRADNDREPITWRTHVADLRAVIAEMSLGTASVVGYSLGGMLALLYTIEAKKDAGLPGFSRLALIDPAPMKMDYRRKFEAEFTRRQNSPEIRQLREELAASAVRESDPAEYRQRTFELAVAPYFADPKKARHLTPFRVTARVQQSVWESLGAEYDLLPELQGIGLPSLFVHGRDDPIPVESSEEGSRAMGSRLVLLDDCGHVPYVEQPGPLFSALDEFLAATDTKRES